MAQKYKGFFDIPGGFSNKGSSPISDDMVVEKFNDLLSSVALPFVYPGMIVYSEEEDSHYSWNGLDRANSENWKKILKAKQEVSEIFSFISTPNNSIWTAINQSTNFEIKNPENSLIKETVFDNDNLQIANLIKTKIYKIITDPGDYYLDQSNIKSGYFGITAQKITLPNLELIREKQISSDEIISLSKTIDLGDIGTTSVVDFINADVNGILLENPNENLNVIIATVNGLKVEYLYKGATLVYGATFNTLTQDDLQLLYKEEELLPEKDFSYADYKTEFVTALSDFNFGVGVEEPDFRVLLDSSNNVYFLHRSNLDINLNSCRIKFPVSGVSADLSIGLALNDFIYYNTNFDINTDIPSVGAFVFWRNKIPSRLVSANLNSSTNIATFVRDDSTSFELDLTPLYSVVVDLNTTTTLTKRNIASINGTNITESITEINTPALVGNNLQIKYVGENGIEQVKSIDLSTLSFTDNSIANATYNASTNIITLTEDDGTTHPINLSEFSIIINTDANGVTTLTQEGVIKTTLSRVGQTGEYEHILNPPLLGASEDAGNALTSGSDGLSYLDELLFGELEDKIFFFNARWDGGLTFTITSIWRIEGEMHGSSNNPIVTTITLDPADVTYDRIDLFVLNSDSTISVIKGVPAANPVEPELANSTLQLKGSFILIPIGATSPEGVSSVLVYDENTGPTSEYATSTLPAATTRIVFNSTTDPNTGTVSIEGTNLEQKDTVVFTPPSPLTLSELGQFNYRIKNKTRNNSYFTRGISHRVKIKGTDSAGNITSEYLQDDPNYDFFNFDTYQLLSVPFPASTAIVNVTEISIVNFCRWYVEFGYFIDKVEIIKGISSPDTSNNLKEIYRYPSRLAFPTTGNLNFLYVDDEKNIPYVWKDLLNDYVPIGGGAKDQFALTDALNITWNLEDNPITLLQATSAVGNFRNFPNTIIATGKNGHEYSCTFVNDTAERSIVYGNKFRVLGQMNPEPNGRTIITIKVQGDEADVVHTVIDAGTPPMTSVSIQDETGEEQFPITDQIRFKGVVFDSINNMIEVLEEAIIPNTIFVDRINGIDSKGKLNNYGKPFQTVDAALSAIPNSEQWTIELIKNGTHYINNLVPVRNFKIYSRTNSILSFANNTNSGNLGVSNLNNVTIRFDLPFGTILFNPINAGYFSMQSGRAEIIADQLTIAGTFYFNRLESLYVNVKNMTLTGTAFYWLWGSKKSYFNVDTLNCIGNANLFTYAIKTTVDIEINLSSVITDGTFYMHPVPQDAKVIIKISSFSTTSTANFIIATGSTDKAIWIFQNAVLEGNFNFSGGFTFQGYWTIQNNSQTYLMGSQGHVTKFQNGSLDYQGTGHIMNGRPGSSLQMNNYHFNFLNNSFLIYISGPTYDHTGFAPVIETFGACSVKFVNANRPLVRASTSASSGMKMVINGEFQTNGLFEAATAIKSLSIEKTIYGVVERLNEVVIRSKGQLLSTPLKSGINYIIDGNISLSHGEYIKVPPGGATISGYSFDSSRISSYGIDNHCIFVSDETTPITDTHSTFSVLNTLCRVKYNGLGLLGKTSTYFSGKNNGAWLPISSLDYLFTTPGGNNYSICIWFKHEGGTTLFTNGYMPWRANCSLYMSGDDLMACISDSVTTVATNIAKDWHYAEVSWDGTNATCFFDGVTVNLTKGGTAKRTNSANFIALGRNSWSWSFTSSYGHGFVGSIDRFFVYNRARTESEKIASYNSGLSIDYVTENKTNLIAYYNMDDKQAGSGNLVIHNIAFTTTGYRARVFDIQDSDGSHALEMVTVNFEGCKEVGLISGYRQGTGITIGFYGCEKGLQFSGAQNGFKLTNTNGFGLGTDMVMFEKWGTLTWNNRFYLEINVDLQNTAVICDFAPANFNDNKLLQINTTLAKIAGAINPSLAQSQFFPNIGPEDAEALFTDNIGLKNTSDKPYGIGSENMVTAADDTAAATAGVPIGGAYVESSTGYLKVRTV